MNEKYGISFEKIASKSGGFFHYANENDINNAELAHHLVCSHQHAAELQIEALQEALDGDKIQQDWGDVMGSTLDIYPQEGTVQINYMTRRIPIQDFKQLLEEWLVFLKT